MTAVPLQLSVSELASLVTKAARGAGLSWGLAEEAGWAAEWLVRRGLPAAEWAADWLARAVEGGLTPVEAGVALADRLAFGGATLAPDTLPDGLNAPGYLLPFLHRIAEFQGSVILTAPSGFAVQVADDGGLTFGAGWGPSTAGWTLALASAHAPMSRPSVAPSVVECLEGLALRTTVPASATSRQDAGATTPDTD